MINLTTKAIEKIVEIGSEQEIEGPNLRLYVEGGGCSGLQYGLKFDKNEDERDQKFEFSGFKVIIDPVSFQYLENVTIDYIESFMGGGFKFNNPQISRACGCGKSFSI